MTIFLFFILPVLILIGLSYGMAYLIQRIDQSLEHDQMQDVTEVEKNNLSI